jgi:hypothetical protein
VAGRPDCGLLGLKTVVADEGGSPSLSYLSDLHTKIETNIAFFCGVALSA